MKKDGLWIKILLICAAIAFLSVVTLFLLTNVFGRKMNDASKMMIPIEPELSRQSENEPLDERIPVKFIDAEQYFNENGELLDIIPVSESDNNKSEKDIAQYLADKGFGMDGIIYEDYRDGSYQEGEISESDETHPAYRTEFISEAGEYWSIEYINGQITAYPALFNLQEEVPVILSEENTLMSYDSVKNAFFKTIPLASVLQIIVLDKIDASALEEIDLKTRSFQ